MEKNNEARGWIGKRISVIIIFFYFFDCPHEQPSHPLELFLFYRSNKFNLYRSPVRWAANNIIIVVIIPERNPS